MKKKCRLLLLPFLIPIWAAVGFGVVFCQIGRDEADTFFQKPLDWVLGREDQEG